MGDEREPQAGQVDVHQQDPASDDPSAGPPPEPGEQETAAPPAVGGAPGVPEKRRRPENLVELYTLPRAAASELLAILARRDAWTTPAEDQEAALRLLPEQDRDLSKTRTLAQHVATSHDGRFAASFEQFLLRAVGQELNPVPSWPPAQGADGPRVFEQLLEHHADALSEKEPPRRLFNAVMIAQSVLMARYRLDVQDAVPVLARVLGPPSALRRERRNPPLTRLRALGDTRLTVDALRTWLDVLSPWIERAVEAEKRAEHAEAEARRHVEVEEELEGQLARLQHQHDAARDEIARLGQDLQQKSDRERGVTLARQHEGSQFRGSMAGFLEDEVLSLLMSVREGLQLDPPRVPYSLERLEDLEHAIEGKVRWLRSSD